MVTKLKNKINFKNFTFTNLSSLYYEPWHVRKPGIFNSQPEAYSEPWNTQKFDGI